MTAGDWVAAAAVAAAEERVAAAEALRVGRPEDVSPEVAAMVALDDEARTAAATEGQVARAFSIYNQGFSVAVLDRECRVLATPGRDLAAILQGFATHPGGIAGVACGQGEDLVVLAGGEQAAAWLREQALEPLPAGYDPHDDDSGVAGRRWHREPLALGVRLGEVPPFRAPRRRNITHGPGRRAAAVALEELGAARPLQAPTQSWWCWRWPRPGSDGKAWSLPLGTRGVGTDGELLRACPADDSIIRRNGRDWRVVWPTGPAAAQPMPEWVAEALGGKRRAVAPVATP